MADDETGTDVWARLREYLAHHPPRPGSERFNGYHEHPRACPPASAAQVHAAEERLGTALPAALRRLYAEVANGGHALGPVVTFYGAAPNLAYGLGDWDTIVAQDLWTRTRPSAWSLHPRIAEALASHPDRYVLVDSPPASALCIGDAGCGISLELDLRTGVVYSYDYYGEVTPSDGHEQSLCTLMVESPSLGVWFARWLDEREHARPHVRVTRQPLTPDLVRTDDLPAPGAVWRGIYRLEPAGRGDADGDGLSAEGEAVD